MMKGKGSVRNSAMRAEARQGTATSGCPLRVVRMRLVAKGVRVMTVLRPAGRHILTFRCGALIAGCALHSAMRPCRVPNVDREPAKQCSYLLYGSCGCAAATLMHAVQHGRDAPDGNHPDST